MSVNFGLYLYANPILKCNIQHICIPQEVQHKHCRFPSTKDVQYAMVNSTSTFLYLWKMWS